MDKESAWEKFKNTGNVYSYLEMKQIEHIEKENALIYENIENMLRGMNPEVYGKENNSK